MQTQLITRRIEIDAGHRVTNHTSKCRNMHGHRYKVDATISGEKFSSGSQEGMLLDFSFLNDEMKATVDALCDHGFIAWVKDADVINAFGVHMTEWQKEQVRQQKFLLYADAKLGKLLVVDFVPTAENLAEFFFGLLAPRVDNRTGGRARLVSVVVYETPNCSAEFRVE